jgi:hypothetical protein
VPSRNELYAGMEHKNALAKPFASDRSALLNGLASTLAFVPGIGDLAGLAADADMYATDPGSRNWLNYGLSAAALIPGIPRVTGKLPKKLYRGTGEGGKTVGTAMLGKGLYTSPYKWKAKLYGDVQEIPLDVGMPQNPLVIEGRGRGGAPDLFNDWLLNHSGEKNMRDFRVKHGDPTEYVKKLGYDGVWVDDEIVKY